MASVLRMVDNDPEVFEVQEPVVYADVLADKANFHRRGRKSAMGSRVRAKDLKVPLAYKACRADLQERLEHALAEGKPWIASIYGAALDALDWAKAHYSIDFGAAGFRAIVAHATKLATSAPTKPPKSASRRKSGRPRARNRDRRLRWCFDEAIRAGVQVGVLAQGDGAWMLSGYRPGTPSGPQAGDESNRFWSFVGEVARKAELMPVLYVS